MTAAPLSEVMPEMMSEIALSLALDFFFGALS